MLYVHPVLHLFLKGTAVPPAVFIRHGCTTNKVTALVNNMQAVNYNPQILYPRKHKLTHGSNLPTTSHKYDLSTLLS